MNTPNNNTTNNGSVGALWIKKNTKGVEYYFIKIGESKYVAFKNAAKDSNNTKRPDMLVFVSQKQDGAPSSQTNSNPKSSARSNAPATDDF